MTDLVAFTYNGVEVTRDSDRLIDVNAMWLAAGKPPNKDPRQWARKGGESFISNLARKLNVPKSHIWKTRRGKHLGGTWAHWSAALSYAQYLSDDFHHYVNEAFREWAEEKANPDLKAERAIEGYRRKGWSDDKIIARLEGKVDRNRLTAILQRHGVSGRGFADATNGTYRGVLGKTAKEYRIRRSLPAKANIRDDLGPIQLAGIRLAELMAGKSIEENSIRGNSACTAVCSKSGHAVRTAMDSMRVQK